MGQSYTSQSETPRAVPAAERRPILLRAYAASEPYKEPAQTVPPTGPILVLDTETTVDETQRLRFGTFQLRDKTDLVQAGIFYDPDALSAQELDAIKFAEKQHSISVIPVDEFIEKVIFTAHKASATFVGFNLPFDLSRLAIGYQRARLWRRTLKKRDGTQMQLVDRSMVGGFSFKLSENKNRAHLRIKHLSRRAAFINFASPGENPEYRSARRRHEKTPHERGFFLDLKTLAAALTSSSHSLDSLAEFLGVERKYKFEDFSRSVDEEFIAYALQDAEVTWQCYVALVRRYLSHGLSKTRTTAIYSEASLGKAYLKQMNIRPWRQAQPDFDPEVIGYIMSAYFGGRAEVQRRREITRTIYCDFASMYPTVCTLMHLWKFVIAQRTLHADATEQTRKFLADVQIDQLQDSKTWQKLLVLVQVQPAEDLFPVRARYGEEPSATIGLNYLSSDRALWFTLADCLASKLLTGKAPHVVRAIRFLPDDPQQELQSIQIAGNPEYQVDPAVDDFYKRVIDLRRSVQTSLNLQKEAGVEKHHLSRQAAEQLTLKLLANATSYGIFVELNVERADDPEEQIVVHTSSGTRMAKSPKREQPGAYFHPLLGTLITGAARLMLACTEWLIQDQGLDWAFCDTDSMAIAAPKQMKQSEFYCRTQKVCSWFDALNPFDSGGSILEIEEENFGPDGQFIPLYCAAISAKRYALFNFDCSSSALIRKASAHGLGHLAPPYTGPNGKQPEESGVLLWQEDIWKAIITSLRSRNPIEVIYDAPEMQNPAVGVFTTATPDRISWFKAYNEGKPYARQIKPFNFFLNFTPKRPDELLREGFDQHVKADARIPRPVAPFSSKPYEMLPQVFDRKTGDHVGEHWLRSYAEAIRSYHLHPETKFLGGGAVDFGPLSRRHVLVSIVEDIGKEADTWEEDEEEGADEDSVVSFGSSEKDRSQMISNLRAVSRRGLSRVAGVSPLTIANANRLDEAALRALNAKAVALISAAERRRKGEEQFRYAMMAQVKKKGLGIVAKEIGIDASNLRAILAGRRAVPGKYLYQSEPE